MPAKITSADDQPRVGASMIAHRISPRPAIDSSEPPRSGRSATGFFEFGTSGTALARPTATIGTLIRNTEPHQKCASSSPPTIGPSAIPAPLVADQTPNAR